ncbi:hypothetical protein TcWFU_008051 [Taenia crassiceps]|uniref:Uncharacterized protein n=1 Tax=Taenia crassiceps TaxID=6207 RepID=A0ABR4Q0C9_9CEST
MQPIGVYVQQLDLPTASAGLTLVPVQARAIDSFVYFSKAEPISRLKRQDYFEDDWPRQSSSSGSPPRLLSNASDLSPSSSTSLFGYIPTPPTTPSLHSPRSLSSPSVFCLSVNELEDRLQVVNRVERCILRS